MKVIFIQCRNKWWFFSIVIAWYPTNVIWTWRIDAQFYILKYTEICKLVFSCKSLNKLFIVYLNNLFVHEWQNWRCWIWFYRTRLTCHDLFVLDLFIHRILNVIQLKYFKLFSAFLGRKQTHITPLHKYLWLSVLYRYVLIEKTCLSYRLDPFNNKIMTCGKILLYYFLLSFHCQYHYVSVNKQKCLFSFCSCSILFNYLQFCPAQFYSVLLCSVLDILFFTCILFYFLPCLHCDYVIMPRPTVKQATSFEASCKFI